MEKILIATRNKDKFKIVSKLLKTTVFNDYDFTCLTDLNEEITDKKECGDLINRSSEKAKNVFENIKNNDFKYIVGVDDGIKMKGNIIENVKDYIVPIINDQFLTEGEIVYIVRAYTFFDKNGKSKSVLTEIPFEYRKLSYELEIKENSYPLSHVLSPLSAGKTVVEMSEDESNEYYSIYSEDKFQEIRENYNDN